MPVGAVVGVSVTAVVALPMMVKVPPLRVMVLLLPTTGAAVALLMRFWTAVMVLSMMNELPAWTVMEPPAPWMVPALSSLRVPKSTNVLPV